MLDWTLQQLQNWVDSTFLNNSTRSIKESDLRDGLKTQAQWVDERAQKMEQLVTETNSSTYIQASIAQAAQQVTLAQQQVAAATTQKDLAIAQVNLANAQRALAETARAEAQAYAAQVQTLITQGYNPKGNWDIATNSPDLTTITKAAGDAYIVLADGTSSITGTSIAMKKGDAVHWNAVDSKWIWRPNATFISDNAVTPEKTSFFRTTVDGDLVISDPWGFIALILKGNGDLVAKQAVLSALQLPNNILSDNPEHLLAAIDGNGRLGFAITKMSELIIKSVRTGSLTVSDVFSVVSLLVGNNNLKENSRYALSQSDANDNLLFAITHLGELLIKKITVTDLNVTGTITGTLAIKPIRFAYGIPTDYLHVISYGQSNSVGGGNGQVAVSQFYDALTTSDGPRTGNAAGLVNYFNDSSVSVPLLGIFNAFTDRIINENFLPYTEKGFRFVGTAPGQGSTTAVNLSKGTTPYNKLINNVTNVKAVATAQEKTCSVPFIGWTQGENEIDDGTLYAAYRATMEQLITDLNTDIKAITGQKNAIPLIGYQVAKYSSGNPDYVNISKAHLDLGLENPLFVCACPSYQFDYVLEGSSGGTGGYIVHFTPAARLQYGAYIALAARQTLMQGKKFLPLHPIKFLVDGNNLKIVYHVPGDGALQFDTTTITNPGDYGFRVLNGATPLTLSNIKIIGKNVVSIDCSQSPMGLTFSYARNGAAANLMDYGTLTGRWGARGNLRDNQGATVKYDGFQLHNWAVASYLTIS
jgi:uncharacterized protein YaiL (DUF2058 family)